jgi:PhnB protein
MDQKPSQMDAMPATGLSPYLTVNGARRALDFYKKAFAAEELSCMAAEGTDKLMHASLKVNGSLLMLSDDFPEYSGGKSTPPPAAVTLHLMVDDADAWWKRAVDAGCEVVMPLADQFWGDRYGQLKDPFGHTWSIGAPVKKA